MKIDIIGTTFNGLGTPPDIENPPDGLRQAGLIAKLEADGHAVTDWGNIDGYHILDIRDPETGINDFDSWLGLSKELSVVTDAILNKKSFPLILGGDCRVLVGIFDALAQKKENTGLIFLDSHADFHTAETSPTGDAADMELAVLTGRGPDQITRFAGKYPMLNERDVVVYGIGAWDHIEKSNIEVYDKERLKTVGIKPAVEDGLRDVIERKLPVWIHFDVDVLDPNVMPVMFPEPGGFSFEEIGQFLQLTWNSCQIEGLSIACYHPQLDTDGSACKGIVNLISDVLSSS